FVEGRNVTIEYRFAENQRDRLPGLVTDLVGRKVAVIAATGGGASILAAKAATTSIPIVFTFAGDPVREGYVASLNRPGGNITGITFFNTLLGAKALGLLHELVPNAAVIAMMMNPKLPESARTLSDVEEAARTLGRSLGLCEGADVRIVARYNASAALLEQTKREPLFRPGPASAVGRSIRLKQVVQVPDLVNDQMYFDREPARVRVVEAGYR